MEKRRLGANSLLVAACLNNKIALVRPFGDGIFKANNTGTRRTCELFVTVYEGSSDDWPKLFKTDQSPDKV